MTFDCGEKLRRFIRDCFIVLPSPRDLEVSSVLLVGEDEPLRLKAVMIFCRDLGKRQGGCKMYRHCGGKTWGLSLALTVHESPCPWFGIAKPQATVVLFKRQDVNRYLKKLHAHKSYVVNLFDLAHTW